jgi:hypothetical protein
VLSTLPRQTGPRRLPSPWPLSPPHSRLRIRSRHPAGEWPVPAVVRRFEEHRLPELVVAAVARDPDVSHAAAAPSGFPGRLAEAWRPAHLRLAGPQLVAERAGFRLVIEQRSGHLNDHALTSCHESMIIVTRTDDRCREPSPCRVTAQRGFSARYSREPRGSARLQPSRRDSPPLPSTARAPAADPRILSEIAPGTGSTRPMYGLVRPLPRPRISVTISVVPLKPRRIPRPSAPPGVPPPPLSARPGRCRAGTQPGTRSRRGRRSPARRRLAARHGSGSAATAAAADGDGRVGGLE